MTLKYTEQEFEQLSWHDNYVYGLQFRISDAVEGDWKSDLALDIDYIVEWACGTDKRPRFQISPATLTFQHVTDLRLSIDWGDSGFQTALHEISIDRIERHRIQNQKVCLDRPYYRWLIRTNLPQNGQIAFGASGFTQVLRAQPQTCDEQKLAPAVRAKAPPW